MAYLYQPLHLYPCGIKVIEVKGRLTGAIFPWIPSHGIELVQKYVKQTLGMAEGRRKFHRL
jgi:hypothetical protein